MRLLQVRTGRTHAWGWQGVDCAVRWAPVMAFEKGGLNEMCMDVTAMAGPTPNPNSRRIPPLLPTAVQDARLGRAALTAVLAWLCSWT
jgi:hypothetical protein